MTKLSKLGRTCLLIHLLTTLISCLVWQATLFSDGNYWTDVVGSFIMSNIVALVAGIYIAIKKPQFLKPFEQEKHG
jgi:hypothetical protein